jgi:hypothetical protein
MSEGNSRVPVTSVPSSTPARTTTDQQQASDTQEAPFYDQWYFRAGVAAVAAIGVMGVLYYQIHRRGSEDEREERDTIPDFESPRNTIPGYKYR